MAEQRTTKSTANIYVELQMLLKQVSTALYGMAKQDRVVLGDKVFDAALNSLSYYRIAYKFMDLRDEYKKKFVLEYSLAETMVTMLCRNVTELVITEEHG